jgi:hypothetical protein
VIVNGLLTLTALGWLAWLTVEPQDWFPDAFAEKGERGAPGPRGGRGPRGAIGPQGPVGPTVEEAIGHLESRLEELELGISATDLQTSIDEIQSELQDVSDKVENVCSELLLSSVEPLTDIYYAAC